jgi:hypothetical protein
MTRLALQTWAEAPRDPVLHEHARVSYRDALDNIAELAVRWRDAGYIPPAADTKAVAATVFSLMHGCSSCTTWSTTYRPMSCCAG